MLAIDRQRRILDLLSQSESLRTTAIAEELGVTDETVRKDFEVVKVVAEWLLGLTSLGGRCSWVACRYGHISA